MQNVQYIINETGEKINVIIPFDEYIELLEEIEDLKIIAERKNEDLIDHTKVKSLINTNE
ncbi:MAG: hypothetical protein N2319_11250 [Candidatus Kapabacteria bacterium]|nr:hypothetical protein [Candidatus Kapabacteria bacterium]